MDRASTGGSKHRTISGAIKRLFYAAARIVAHRDEAAPPAPSRRRSGKTEGDFYRVARRILHAVSRCGAVARGRYAVLGDAPAMPATPASAISIPAEFMYADPDWNACDITNPLYDHSGGFENDGDNGFDTVNEYLSPGL